MLVFLSSYITCSVIVLCLMAAYWYTDREWIFKSPWNITTVALITLLAVVFSYFFIFVMCYWAIKEARKGK